jgi:hypothetical protein
MSGEEGFLGKNPLKITVMCQDINILAAGQ